MAKQYESPFAEELFITAEDVMADSPLAVGSDEAGSDLAWDLLD